MPVDKLHYLNVGPKGTFQKSGQYSTTPEDVDALVAGLRQKNVRKLILYFHGGLVDEEGGMKTAEELIPTFTGPELHALFFIWETGFTETIRRNIATIYDSKLFRKIVRIVVGNVASQLGLSVGGKGAGMKPSPEEIERLLAADPQLMQLDAAAKGAAATDSIAALERRRADIEASVEEDVQADFALPEDAAEPTPANELLKPEVKADVDATGKGVSVVGLVRALAQVVYRVVRRYIEKRNHGLYPTVFEEILREVYVADVGAWVWSSMKKAGSDMWAPNDGLQGEKQHAGRYLLERLARLQKETGITVDLFGHSAGSIAIIEMLKAADRDFPDFKVRNIVFLAPACTLELFAKEIVAKPARYERFRMYTMKDEWEAKDALISAIPRLYPSSLLYFISGVLEDESDTPIAGMHRYLSNSEPYAKPDPFGSVHSFLSAGGSNRLVLSQTEDGAGDGLRCDSIHHGGFVDPDVIRASLKHLIAG